MEIVKYDNFHFAAFKQPHWPEVYTRNSGTYEKGAVSYLLGVSIPHSSAQCPLPDLNSFICHPNEKQRRYQLWYTPTPMIFIETVERGIVKSKTYWFLTFHLSHFPHDHYRSLHLDMFLLSVQIDMFLMSVQLDMFLQDVQSFSSSSAFNALAANAYYF